MEFVLREQINNQYYCKDHTKIITFPNEQMASQFVNSFANYAMAMGMARMMSNPGLLMEVQQVIHSTTIEEKPKDYKGEYITIEEILREKGV